MEDNATEKSLISRKKDARSLFKKCFKNSMFSFVPYEIWRDFIVSNADLKTIVVLSQTCHVFEDLVDNIGENNFNLALLFRKEGQIDLAKKYLFKCANNNNSTAMLHLGDAYYSTGWGLRANEFKAAEWFKKSAELGNAHAMAYYAEILRDCLGFGEDDHELSWAEKAVSSNNSFAVGYCCYWGVGKTTDRTQAISYFEASAKEGDEFGQEWLADCYYDTRDFEKAFALYAMLAARGLRFSQYRAGEMYSSGAGAGKDLEKSVFWYRKAAKQGDFGSKEALKKIEKILKKGN